MGIDILKIWEKTGTYKDIQDCKEGDLLLLSDGMILKVIENKKFALKIKAEVLKNRPRQHTIIASTRHGKIKSFFDDFAEYITTVPMNGEWTYDYLVQRRAKQLGEVAKHLYE